MKTCNDHRWGEKVCSTETAEVFNLFADVFCNNCKRCCGPAKPCTINTISAGERLEAMALTSTLERGSGWTLSAACTLPQANKTSKNKQRGGQ
jgi:hypothetical protein